MDRGVNGYPPPGPRIETDARGFASPFTPSARGRSGAAVQPVMRLDLDRATEAEIVAGRVGGHRFATASRIEV